VHAAGYQTAELGTLGAVVERGTGPIDMVLVTGFGLGASAFEGFQQRNAERYRMLAVTLPGFEGSAAPPMPPAGASYGEQTWTNAAVDAVLRLIRERGLTRPVLVGHFINGTQIAARVALEHPELVRALVLLSGTPRFEPTAPTPYWPANMTLEKKVAAVDAALAPRWFKTVTRKTWVAGNFGAGDYSVDETRGRRFADLANEPPLPVLIRYLCEFHASDLAAEIAALETPLLLVQPGFTPAILADPARAYLPSYFDEPWKGVREGRLEGRPSVRHLVLEGAGILVMDDEPAEVDGAIAAFLQGK
jgi:pimeloyl-ACP methyl ester carboxylesterase